MHTQTKLRAARRVTVLAGGTFALALTLAACGAGNDTPDGAVENFLDNGAEDMVNAVLEGDSAAAKEAAEEHLCADDVSGVEEAATMFEGMSEEERQEAMDMGGDSLSMFEDMSYEIGEATEDGDTASVDVSITADGETTDETFDLVKEDDAWKICGTFA
ncbi:DUF4878 domain-containing protein [Glycomyces harbinensis]|uniref:DUF4878 domain-containing protein n=1 Tax=Glycomyces harbinensis TaxID=58114 RepID=A0A1G7BSV1_9ACTN|nr:DUF4878 domain-containing protein [Glycomyces harbinensis]SDE29275.1 protein of unknown function [Glycomyces harbinensis]